MGFVDPFVGDTVHYVSHGSADGMYSSTCRAAIVAEICPEHEQCIAAAVINPTGIFFKQHTPHSEQAHVPGSWHWMGAD